MFVECCRLLSRVFWRPLAVGAVAVLIVGCAAPGPRFAGVAETPPNLSDVYIYRVSHFFATGQPFSVSVDDKPAGEIFNASYLLIRIPPGLHTLAVSPGALAKTSRITVDAKAGRTSFYEFDFVAGPLANVYFIGSDIEPRTHAQAISDLKELDSATTEPVLLLGAPGMFAEVEDVNAVPLLDDRGRQGYRDWLTKPLPRAFVIARDGTWNSSWGRQAKPGFDGDPARRAIQNCQARKATGCAVYAVDRKVVWDKSGPTITETAR